MEKPAIDNVFILDAVPIKKASEQIADKIWSSINAVTPRLDFDDLMQFFEINTWHRRCIALKARVIGGFGWTLDTDDQNKNPDDEYNRISDFLKKPSQDNIFGEELTFTELCYRCLIDYLSIGNGYIEVARNNLGEISDIYHIPGRTVRRDKEFGGYWQLRAQKKKFFRNFGDKEFGDNEILHYYNYDPQSDYYGLPDWIPSMVTMGLDRAAASFNTYMFENGMLATSFLIIEGGDISPNAKAELRNFLGMHGKGIKNTGRLIVIPVKDPNVKVRVEKAQLEAKEKEGGFMKLRENSRDEVIAAHGVPPRLVGVVTAGKIGDSQEAMEQFKIFKETVIDPEQHRFEELINKSILKGLDAKKWRIKFNEMDVTDMMQDAEYAIKLRTAELLTEDEARDVISRPPLIRKGDDNLGSFLKGLQTVRERLENEG
jgi:PBSX family phage portal protein